MKHLKPLRHLALAVFLGGVAGAPLAFIPPALAERDEFQGLPKGPGQEETFYVCSACHSIKLVLQQRMNRVDWDETLDYMIAEQAMEKMEAAERKVVLDYLGEYLGRNVPR